MHRYRYAEGFAVVRSARKDGVAAIGNLFCGLDGTAIMANSILAKVNVDTSTGALDDGEDTGAGSKLPIIQ
jgi:hypothetical protein